MLSYALSRSELRLLLALGFTIDIRRSACLIASPATGSIDILDGIFSKNRTLQLDILAP